MRHDHLYDDPAVDLDAAAQGAFDRRHSISGTPSCRGCNDPQCGYCEQREEAERPMRVAAEVEAIAQNDGDLVDLLHAQLDDDDSAVAAIIRLAMNNEDFAVGARIRNLFRPRIDELADRRAA